MLIDSFLPVANASSATRLYLGFADASAFHGNPGFYTDDSGSLAADLRIAGS